MAATPRANVVSTAGFYDWSTEDVGEVSMSNIYRKLAVNHNDRMNRGNKVWCTDGVHLNPGRMFIRDKAELTKGEKEIIAGIYKNRGNVHKNNSRYGVIAHVKSHSEAWLVGKPMSKNGGKVGEDRCSVKMVSDTLFSKNDTEQQHKLNETPIETTSLMCEKCKENLNHKYEQDKKSKKTPSDSPMTSLKHRSTARVVSEGGAFIESGKTFIDPEEGSKKKKVFVDVFLPKFPTQGEMTSVSINLDQDSRKSVILMEGIARKSQFKAVDEEQELASSSFIAEGRAHSSSMKLLQRQPVLPSMPPEKNRKPVNSLSSSGSNRSTEE